ncbi:MAG: FAD synthetase family protein, partial [Anaerolineae bacterium]|nr:FAD synthetase family protein [Anaerolineae bacterium]
MQHGTELKDVLLERPSWVTIGVFDGVHRGHQALIRQLVEAAHAAEQYAVVITFHPHPDVVLRDIQERYYLTSPQQRTQLLHDLGVDTVITQPFDDELRQVRATEYVDRLTKHLQMRSLWVGKDFALGYQREGTVKYLTELGQERNFEVRPIDLVTTDGNGGIITSTKIRALLQSGDVQQAQHL